jgi:hypothetical protein
MMIELALALLAQQDPMRTLQEALRLMQRSEEDLDGRRLPPSQEKQRDVIARLERLIREAREAERTADRRDDGPDRREARRPDDGRRAPVPTPPPVAGSKFVARESRDGWNANLPPGMRESILHAIAHIDEYPEEYRAVLREWSRRLADPK